MQDDIHYLYTLSHKNEVFYVGISKQPEMRYRQHCNGYHGTPTYEYIYWLLENGEMPNISIIDHYNDKNSARVGEHSLIKYFMSISNKLCNKDPNPINNRIITCRPPLIYRRKRNQYNYTHITQNLLKDYHTWLNQL